MRVCACICTGLRVRVRACSFSYPTCKAHAPYYIVICVLSGCTKFFDLSHKWHDFRGKKIGWIQNVYFDFPYNFCLKHLWRKSFCQCWGNSFVNMWGPEKDFEWNEGWVSRCSVLTGVDRWLRCGQFTRCGDVPSCGVPAVFTPSWLMTSWCPKHCWALFYALAAPSSLLRYWWVDRGGWRMMLIGQGTCDACGVIATHFLFKEELGEILS